jgi:hypothetical protein
MLKSCVSALTILVAVTGSALAAQNINQTTSVGVVGASFNNIGAASGSFSGAVGLGVATNVNAITQNANPTNVNLNSLRQLQQEQTAPGFQIQ